MRSYRHTFIAAIIGGLLLSAPSIAAQQKKDMAPAQAQQPAPPAPPALTPRQRVVIVNPVRVYDPFFYNPYPYPYPSDYMDAYFGYVKIDTKLKDVSVYVDGGFANKIEKAKKFALPPGTHNIELRDSDGRPILQQKVAVLVGKTTNLKIG